MLREDPKIKESNGPTESGHDAVFSSLSIFVPKESKKTEKDEKGLLNKVKLIIG